MAHYSGYIFLNTDEEREVLFSSMLWGNANVNNINQKGLHFKGYKSIDENSSTILGLQSKYGNND